MFKPQKSQPVMQDQPAALVLDECLAKTYGQKQPGRKILNHCHIVGEVAKALLGRMPNWLVTALFPPGSELIAACHDLGKVSPTFQEKIYQETEGYQKNPKPELANVDPKIEKLWGGHAGVSQATAEALNVGPYIPEILGQHHGYSPNLVNKAEDAVFGGKVWQERRSELLDGLKHLLSCDFPVVSNDLQAKALAGLTTVSDWIGSGSLFDDPTQDWRPNINKALDHAGFVQPSIRPDLSFFDLFGFEPRDIQRQLISSSQQSGVYVLEAPMGIGKTEAALYAAYQLMASQQATGLYFALPTQLTSDKIHERVTQFLTKILTADSPHQKALLLHGNAWLKQTELGVEGNPNGSWFESGKRGILAPFAVGTIDQALMAVMNVKHGFVRAFGLAGKVVILDEVHSYDAYTGTLLDKLVTALQGLQCTVIILSATLTQQRRSALMGQTVCSQEYPLISAKPKQGALLEITVPSAVARDVAIQCCQVDDLALQAALDRAEQGQQVLWIENTVAEAQAIYQRLSAMDMPIECGLLHSRFLKTDRALKETYWVALYGKENHQARQIKGRILVGTQILEQSLDIDADFLISRFAPTDMLLQRLGRLWRHDDTPRPSTAKCEAWLLTPDFEATITDAKGQFGNSSKVYSPYVLCRSLDVWRLLDSVALPEDIRALIEATYIEREEQGPMLAYLAELEKARAKLKQLALVGLSKAGKTLSENRASTRYSEQDSVQVLLLKSYRHTADKSATEITFLDGEKKLLPRNLKIYDKPQWRDLAATLLQNTVQVADYLAPQALTITELNWLKDYFYLGDPAHGESLLRIALVDDADNLKSLSGGQALANYRLSYNEDFGYQAVGQINLEKTTFKIKTAVLIGAMAVSGIASADVNKGLVAYWNFDDCTAKDNSGNGHDGTIQGSPQCVDGSINKALKFNGIDNSIVFQNMDQYFSTNDFSISFFLKGDKLRGEYIIGKREICDHSRFIDITRDSVQIGYELDDGVGNYTSAAFKKPAGIVFVTMVRKGNAVYIYHNGKLVSKNLTTSAVADISNTAPFGISVSPCIAEAGRNMFSGLIDEIRLYSRAISASEVSQLNNLAYPVSGTIKSLGTHTVSCKNETTGQVINIAGSKATTYDCEVKGLKVNAGEAVSILIKGNAE